MQLRRCARSKQWVDHMSEKTTKVTAAASAPFQAAESRMRQSSHDKATIAAV
jgi:hypothetical protein